MSRLLLAAPLLAATACATTSPYAPVRDVAYQAMGSQPFWQVVIGDDAIVFRPVAGGGERRWPRVLPRTVDGVRTWQSGTGAESITLTARPGPCADEPREGRELRYEHFVTVQMGEEGPELRGCGGRLLPREGTR
ncbi:MAG TPA: hypothetical protein VMG08_18300 [Allosphingosinicella sp.]|nr:hypothetical protein [Allosphingosinicella sp.]